MKFWIVAMTDDLFTDFTHEEARIFLGPESLSVFNRIDWKPGMQLITKEGRVFCTEDELPQIVYPDEVGKNHYNPEGPNLFVADEVRDQNEV